MPLTRDVIKSIHQESALSAGPSRMSRLVFACGFRDRKGRSVCVCVCLSVCLTVPSCACVFVSRVVEISMVAWQSPVFSRAIAHVVGYMLWLVNNPPEAEMISLVSGHKCAVSTRSYSPITKSLIVYMHYWRCRDTQFTNVPGPDPPVSPRGA